MRALPRRRCVTRLEARGQRFEHGRTDTGTQGRRGGAGKRLPILGAAVSGGNEATRRRATRRTPRGRTAPARRSPRRPRRRGSARRADRPRPARRRPWRCRRAWSARCPVTPASRLKASAWTSPFWPVVASSTSRTCRGWSGQAPLDDSPDLGQLVHQLLLVLEPARGVDEHRVEAARLGGGDRVERDGARIGAGALRDDRHPELLAPDPELLDRGGAERVGRGQRQRAVPRRAAGAASLAIVVVLPVPLTPTNRITDGAVAELEGAGARRARGGHGSRSPAPDARPRRCGRRRRGSARGRRRPARASSSRPTSAAISASSTSSQVASVAAAPPPRIERSRAPKPDGVARSPMPRGSRRGRATVAGGSGGSSRGARLRRSRRRRNTYAPTSTGTSARRSERTRLTAASVMVTP